MTSPYNELEFEDVYDIIGDMIKNSVCPDEFFYNGVPSEYLLDIGVEFENAEWCQYAIDKNGLDYIDSPDKRTEENFHDLNRIMKTE